MCILIFAACFSYLCLYIYGHGPRITSSSCEKFRKNVFFHCSLYHIFMPSMDKACEVQHLWSWLDMIVNLLKSLLSDFPIFRIQQYLFFWHYGHFIQIWLLSLCVIYHKIFAFCGPFLPYEDVHDDLWVSWGQCQKFFYFKIYNLLIDKKSCKN